MKGYKTSAAYSRMKRPVMMLACFLLAATTVTSSSTEDNLVDTVEENSQSRPWFTNPQRMQNIMKVQPIGTAVRLNCHARGNPTPRVSWFKDGRPVVQQANSPTSRPADQFTLYLVRLTKNDSGEYTCVVANHLGSVEWTYHLDVYERFKPTPTVICQDRNRTVIEGEDVVVRCEVYSYLTAFVRWIKHYHVNGTYFDKNGAPYAKLIKDAAAADVREPFTLTLNNITLNDAGFYTLLAGSPSGASHQTVAVRVNPKPFPGYR
ncbi:fibroblast growth factor receptor 3-like [Ixodes scapularis]